ncbi:hypothetical protein IWX49DRAFT_181350 [Phyllosticta citricarpa]
MLEFLNIELFKIGLSLSLSLSPLSQKKICRSAMSSASSRSPIGKMHAPNKTLGKKPRPRGATVNEVLVSVPLKRQKKLMCATAASEESRVNHSHGARFCAIPSPRKQDVEVEAKPPVPGLLAWWPQNLGLGVKAMRGLAEVSQSAWFQGLEATDNDNNDVLGQVGAVALGLAGLQVGVHERQHDAGGDGAVGDKQLQARNVGRHAGARRIAAESGGSEGADGQHGGGFEQVGRWSTEESVKTRTSRC